jgi:zinc-ribbon domain
MAMKSCFECGASVSSSAKTCPHCGKRNPTVNPRHVQIAGGIVAAVVAVPVLWILIAYVRYEPTPWNEADSSSMAIVKVQSVVENNLKAPATAEWPGILEVGTHAQHVGDQLYRVNSWVDADNEFGAKVRMQYAADIKQTAEHEWEIVSFNWRQ